MRERDVLHMTDTSRTSNERCKCPNGSHGQKHTTACYEARIQRLQAAVDGQWATTLWRCLNRLHYAVKGCASIGFEESSPVTNERHAGVWNDLNVAQKDAAFKLEMYSKYAGSPSETSEGYAGDSFVKLLADMRVAADAARNNTRDGVALFVEQWMERIRVLSAKCSAVEPRETTEHPAAQTLRDLANGCPTGDMVSFAPNALRALADSIDGVRPEEPSGARDWVIVCGNSWYGRNGKFVTDERDARGFSSCGEAQEHAKGMRCPWSVRERTPLKASGESYINPHPGGFEE